MSIKSKFLRKYLKVIDVILETADARLPASSRYPNLAGILGSKKRILVLTRIDLAAAQDTAHWLEVFQARGDLAVAVNARTGEGSQVLRRQLAVIAKGKKRKLAPQGLRDRPLRIMVVGIPNVGKSSLINRLIGRGVARTGNRPGITLGPQWLRMKGSMELLDMPGVLWPHWHEQRPALWLGAIGCVPDGILSFLDIGNQVAEFLLANAPSRLQSRYRIKNKQLTVENLMESIGRQRGYISLGGVIDQEKAAITLINDFREGLLGRFTLEAPSSEG